MKILITSRHVNVSKENRERAEAVLERLSRRAHRPHRGEVIFDRDHSAMVVELHLYLPRGQVRISRGEAQDVRTAIDRAADKLSNQLDKERTTPQHERGAPVPEL